LAAANPIRFQGVRGIVIRVKNLLLRRVAVLLVASIAVPAAVACGGRTGDLSWVDAGSGAVTGSGGFSSGTNPGVGNVPGAAAGRPPVGRPPVVGSGGTTGKVPPPFPTGGGTTAIGGGAGFFGTGGVPGSLCTPPICACGDCVSNCACTLGGQITQLCIDQCNGVVGTGGAPQVFCGRTESTTRLCPSLTNFPFPSCCTSSFECGIELAPSTSPMYPFATGCQALKQPGRLEPGCPDLGELFMSGGQVGVPPGCCRPDGTCGIDASQIELGCVQSLSGGKPIKCPESDAGVGGRPPGTGGRPVIVDAGFD
jgi:hypothetical protein